MRRFETILSKPVHYWEVVVVDGKIVRTREGVVGGDVQGEKQRTHKTAKDARSYVEKEIASRRKKGFVEIKRVAAAEPEQMSVERSQRFEWDDGGDRRFREVVQRDRQARYQDGYVVDGEYHDFDTGGARTENHDTIAEASAAYERMIEETRRLTARAAKPATPAERDLEARCRTNPDARDAWAVYADALIERDDPVGEVAALALGGKSKQALAAIPKLFPELIGDDGAELAFELRHGFARQVTIRRRPGSHGLLHEIAERVLASPLCGFVESVTFGPTAEIDNDWRSTVEAVIESSIAEQLTTLTFDAAEGALTRGDVRAVLATEALPKLRSLTITNVEIDDEVITELSSEGLLKKLTSFKVGARQLIKRRR